VAAILPAAAETTTVFWAAETAVSGLSFCSSAVAATDAVITVAATDVVTASLAATTITAVTGLSGLSFFPASAAATTDAANQYVI